MPTLRSAPTIQGSLPPRPKAPGPLRLDSVSLYLENAMLRKSQIAIRGNSGWRLPRTAAESRPFPGLGLGGLLFWCACLSAGGVGAETLRVPADYPSIQGAISAATRGDTVLVASGTYTGNSNKNLNFGGKDLVVRSEAGPDQTVIDCKGRGRGFLLHQGESPASLISGFTIRGGNPGGEQGFVDYGGAIGCFYDAIPTIENCVIQNNRSDWYGGGIYIKGDGSSIFAPITIRNCTLSGNEARWSGGGIQIGAAGDNSIYVAAMVNCTISENEAETGGGISVIRGVLSLRNCTISKNLARSEGGGVEMFQFPKEAVTSLNIAHCTISENSASTGGGIYLNSSVKSCALENSIIWENSANDIKVEAGGPMPQINYCNVTGGWPYGSGNISADPHFSTRLGYPFILSPSSPCIDAGQGEDDGLRWGAISANYGRRNSAAPDMGRYGGPQVVGSIGGCHLDSVLFQWGDIENPEHVLGAPYPGKVPAEWQNHATRIPSGTWVTLSLGAPISNGPGPEFYIEEVDEEDGVGVADPYQVEVSPDGFVWFRLAPGLGDSVFDLAGIGEPIRYVKLAGLDQEAEIDGLSVFRCGGR